MPNTPALLGAGIAGLYAEPSVPTAAREMASYVLNAAGTCVWLESEAQIEAVTAVSGSGPAYFFLVTEAMREAGVKLGLTPEVAGQLALQTFRSEEHTSELQSLMRKSYAVFCLKKKRKKHKRSRL